MTRPDCITVYRIGLSQVFEETTSGTPNDSPLGMVAAEIKEMISSYLADATSFHTSHDIVNEYASLTYAHGWLDAARYLGLLEGNSIPLLLPDDEQIPLQQHDRLIEKATRYERMLNEVDNSVKVAPEIGSPLFQAAGKIKTIVKQTRDNVSTRQSKATYTAALGELSYGYGWLDAGVRAGLFRICGNPHLFTTETEEP